jgi:hypothetical protein
MLKRPMRRRKRFQGCKEAITLPVSWFGVGCPINGVTPLNVCKKEVKTGAQVHQEDVLQGVVNPLNTTVFSGEEWVLQQDSASCTAKTTKEWLRRNIPAIIIAEDWPLGESRPLNPLDCKLWPLFKGVACQKYHNNLESLKRSPRRQWQRQ